MSNSDTPDFQAKLALAAAQERLAKHKAALAQRERDLAQAHLEERRAFVAGWGERAKQLAAAEGIPLADAYAKQTAADPEGYARFRELSTSPENLGTFRMPTCDSRSAT